MNDIISTTAPAPTVKAEFHVERHPDPIVQSFIELTLQLRKENDALKSQVSRLKLEIIELEMARS
jgi:hypothetical protein